MSILFQNGYIWDGESEARIAGDVLVEGDRITAVGAVSATVPTGGDVINLNGATLMPGLVDAHGHLGFTTSAFPNAIEDTPPEETVLITMHAARLVLEMGFTGIVGAGSPQLRAEIVIRNEIDAGRIPGPRLMASTPTLTVTGGMNDARQLHNDRSLAAMIIDGPDAARRAVRLGYREGVDVIKVNISGDDFFPRPGGQITALAEDEMTAIGETSRDLGLLISAHARSAESIKRALRHGVRLINHADFADEEALDMLEAAKDHIFVAPTIGFYHSLLHDSQMPAQVIERMGVKRAMEANIAVHTELRRRGVRSVIGGDYGVPWQPNGSNARDIAHFVEYLGYDAVGALRAATSNGYALMGLEGGVIGKGKLADILVVDGDPTRDPSLLADRSKILVVMKAGEIVRRDKTPAVQGSRAA